MINQEFNFCMPNIFILAAILITMLSCADDPERPLSAELAVTTERLVAAADEPAMALRSVTWSTSPACLLLATRTSSKRYVIACRRDQNRSIVSVTNTKKENIIYRLGSTTTNTMQNQEKPPGSHRKTSSAFEWYNRSGDGTTIVENTWLQTIICV